MNFLDLFKKTLNEEKLPENKKGILLLDIDDTLLKSDSSIMKIYRKLPTDKKEVALSTDEYAKESVTPDIKKYYDYRDFNNQQKVYNSIVKGAPLFNNLKVVDNFYRGGYDIGVLTARGCEDVVAKAIKTFLKVRNENGELVKPNINRENIHAVNTVEKSYPGNTDFEKKQNILRKYAREYDYVYFIDDDPKNLNALKSLKKSDPDISKKLRSIDAGKNTKLQEESISEKIGLINEMAVKDVDADIISDLQNKNYESALKKYFDKVKTTPTYSKFDSAENALKRLAQYGISRTFNALEKSGKVPAGSAAELKKIAASPSKEFLDGISYNSNSEKEEKPEKKEPIQAVEKKSTGSKELDKIAKRMEAYDKLRKQLEDYSNSNSIKAFIVDVEKNGENGVDFTVKKPKISIGKEEDVFKTKTERMVEPMLKMRQNFIPAFIQKEAEKSFSASDKLDISKAEGLGQEYYEATKNKLYSLFMAKYLNNMVLGFNEFINDEDTKNMSNEEKINDIKNGAIFPYNNFVKLDNWFKQNKINSDKEKVMLSIKKEGTAQTKETILKVKNEYVSFLNGIERAIANDKIIDFLSDESNMKIIEDVLTSPKSGTGSESKPVSLKGYVDKNGEEKNLAPSLKSEYNDREDLEFDKKATKKYAALYKNLNDLLRQYNSESDEASKDRIEVKIIKTVEQVKDALLDRLSGLDILDKTAGSGILGQNSNRTPEKIIELKNKAALSKKSKNKTAFDPNDKKYDEYYTPDATAREEQKEADDMYSELKTALMSKFQEIISKGLRSSLLNITNKRYTKEELEEFYSLFKSNPEKVVDILGMDKFKAPRN